MSLWDAETWELSWSFLHGPADSRFLGTWFEMVVSSAVYLLILAILSYAMRSRRSATAPRPLWITPFVLLQNAVMTIYSAYVFIGAALVLLKNIRRPGFNWLEPFCDPDGSASVVRSAHSFKDGMDFWFYHFYLSKYFEWFDTIFLLLRAKAVFPPSNSQYFLHVFHHLVTPSIVWYAWRVHFAGAWIGPLSNGFVHVWMYLYYTLTELGMNRKYGGILITPIQIFQFILAMSTIVYETAFPEKCATSTTALYWMWFTYAVFLGFFIKLYTDKKQERSTGKKGKSD